MDKPEIDDVGEFLPYARKHMVPEGESVAPVVVHADSKITLVDLWPEPEWQAWDGIEPQALAHLFLIYRNIRRGPRSTDHWGVPRKKWEAAYVKSVEILRRLFVGVKTVSQAEALFEEYLTALKQAFPEYTMETKHINDCYHKFSTGSDNSRKRIGSAFSLDQRDLLLKKWLVKDGWPDNKIAAKYRHFPVEASDGLTWCVVTPTKSSYTWLREDEGLSEQVAIDRAGARNREEFPPQEEASKDQEKPGRGKIYIPKKRAVLTDSRIGPVFRADNAVAEDLLSEFGFRGVQFGNALTVPERQQWVNDAFDAFCDLADILGFKRSWIGLGGVGLAFGARGAGSGVAHFEPTLNITNLTRSSGAGSFAHEFFHALDYRLGNKLLAGEYLTANLDSRHSLIYDIEENQQSGHRLRFDPRQVSQIRSLYAVHRIVYGEAGRRSEFYQRSDKLADQHGSKKYWIETIELFARAFECYIQDLLASHGRFSPWLVHGTLASDCDSGRENMWPYPIGDERKEINCKFEEFIKTLKLPNPNN